MSDVYWPDVWLSLLVAVGLAAPIGYVLWLNWRDEWKDDERSGA